MQNTPGKCVTCKYKAPAAHGQLECRRYPPAPTTVALEANRLHVHTAWPTVAPDAWCGEWKLDLVARG